MAESDEPTPAPDAGVEDTTVAPATMAAESAPTAARPAFRDRVWTFRAMLAVALAALVIGTGAGAGLAAVTGDDGPDGPLRISRMDGPGIPGGPHGGSGFGPPGLDRQDRRELREEMREDLKDMRQDLRDRRQELRQDDDDPAAPSPSATPSPDAG